MQNDTRDLRLSVEQIRALLNLLGPAHAITVDPDEAYEIASMLQDALENSDSETLNDFTA